MSLPSVTPAEAAQLVAKGATLVDIRDADEYARRNIPGAVNLPIGDIDRLPRQSASIVFHCRSGARTSANAGRLAAVGGDAPCHVLAGGIDAWQAAGLPTAVDRGQPLEIMRQVQLVAGGLVLLGIALGFLVAPGFFGLSAFVGTGLVMAGATGWCGTAKLLRVMPWNRRARAA